MMGFPQFGGRGDHMHTKILVKVKDGDNLKWIHLCYVDTDLWQEFLQDNTSEGFNQTLSEWCYEDFNMQIPMATIEDINTLKKLIRIRYKRLYPEVFLENQTDRQGWIRVWFTQKVKGAINDRKQCI